MFVNMEGGVRLIAVVVTTGRLGRHFFGLFLIFHAVCGAGVVIVLLT